VEGLSDRLYWAFHILEGTVFKLSNLSFAYLHGFYHFISFCLYLYRKAERKITACLYVGEGSEYRPFQIFDPFARPLTWGGDLKSGRVYFQTLLLHKISPQASKRPLLASHRAWSNALSGTLGPLRSSFLRNASPRRTRKAPSAAVVRRRRFGSHRSQEGTWLLPVQNSRQVQITNSSRHEDGSRERTKMRKQNSCLVQE